MQRDFKNYDYLTISVKSALLEHILECYAALGWREVRREDDREYYDMKYIALRRPHKIENKDRLQLLQVRMESAVNSVSSVNAKKHAKSGIIFTVLAVIALGLAALGLWLIFGLSGQIGFISGIVSCGLAASVLVAATVMILAMRKPEEEAAKNKIIQTLKTLQSLLEEARALVPAELYDEESGQSDLPDGLYDDAEDAETHQTAATLSEEEEGLNRIAATLADEEGAQSDLSERLTEGAEEGVV